MNKLFSVIALFLAIFCWNMNFAQNYSEDGSYAIYGEKISSENALGPLAAQNHFESLTPGDTLNIKFSTKVKSLCKMKGCWMVLELPGEEVRVSFKDYGFFVPKDIEDREVIVAGKAYLEEVSVENQKHYAKDAGKTPEEITLINEPALTRSFMAHGVLVKE